MRLKIQSSDRVGISQEILAIFAKRSWNLKAIEVQSSYTYVHIDETKLSLLDIKRSLSTIDDIVTCSEIQFLPTELKAHHLQTLLARMPDPLIDIDADGRIIVFNDAAKALISPTNTTIKTSHINDFIEPCFETILQNKSLTTSLTFAGKPYLAEVTPVIIDNKINGAVIVLRSMKSLGRQISLLQAEQEQSLESIIGESQEIQTLKEQVLRFAKLDLPVLINGETGTGKELVARAIHQASDRAKSSFLAINCAALPENLLESELFGYSQGAFTGAQKGGKPGLFELAEGGTIFLDEIAEMSTYLQAKLLRFLQDFRFRRLGSTKELTANVRIISASHQNFEQLLSQQHFRDDLFYRLNVLSLFILPLRARAEDIALLAHYFVENSAQQINPVNQDKPIISEAALALLKKAPWPGNVRQLQNILFRLVALNKSGVIELTELNEALSGLMHTSGNNKAAADEIECNKNASSDGNMSCDENTPEFKDWQSAQEHFEETLLTQLLPMYPTTRKLAKRLKVSHNKIAMKLRKYAIKS